MPLSEFEIEKIKFSMNRFFDKRRPPVEIRDKLDIAYRIENQSVIIFEVRPSYNNPSQKIEIPFAKTTFVKKSKKWNIYWQRADMKWHPYPPQKKANSFDEFLDVVDKDEFSCFWG